MSTQSIYVWSTVFKNTTDYLRMLNGDYFGAEKLIFNQFINSGTKKIYAVMIKLEEYYMAFNDATGKLTLLEIRMKNHLYRN